MGYPLPCNGCNMIAQDENIAYECFERDGWLKDGKMVIHFPDCPFGPKVTVDWVSDRVIHVPKELKETPPGSGLFVIVPPGMENIPQRQWRQISTFFKHCPDVLLRIVLGAVTFGGSVAMMRIVLDSWRRGMWGFVVAALSLIAFSVFTAIMLIKW